MVTFTKAHGKMTLKMVSGSFIYKMVKNMKVCLLMAKNMVREFTCGRMGIDIKGNLPLIRGMGLGCMFGVMGGFIKGSGRMIG